MKGTLIIFIIFLLTNISSAQTDLQKCSEEMNDELNTLVAQGKWNDSTALKRVVEADKKWKACVIGKSIPDFKINSISGQELNAEKLKGKILVINFWFIACAPCIAEMPALNQLVSEYKDKNVLFLGFTYESKEDIVSMFLPKVKFDFNVVPNAQFVEDSFGVSSHPTMFIVDKYGKVKKAWAGGSTDEKDKTEAYLKTKPIIDELLKAE